MSENETVWPVGQLAAWASLNHYLLQGLIVVTDENFDLLCSAVGKPELKEKLSNDFRQRMRHRAISAVDADPKLTDEQKRLLKEGLNRFR